MRREEIVNIWEMWNLRGSAFMVQKKSTMRITATKYLDEKSGSADVPSVDTSLVVNVEHARCHIAPNEALERT